MYPHVIVCDPLLQPKYNASQAEVALRYVPDSRQICQEAHTLAT